MLRGVAADQLVRTELDAIDYDYAEKASLVYQKDGIGGLSKGIIERQFRDTWMKPFVESFTPCSLLANFAIARRTVVPSQRPRPCPVRCVRALHGRRVEDRRDCAAGGGGQRAGEDTL